VQFGKLTGVGMAVLGALLLLLQFSFLLNSGRPENRPIEAHRDFSSRDGFGVGVHRVPMLPGILGSLFVVGGVVVFFLARTKDEPQPNNAAR
jgi:hypothetical protein